MLKFLKKKQEPEELTSKDREELEAGLDLDTTEEAADYLKMHLDVQLSTAKVIAF